MPADQFGPVPARLTQVTISATDFVRSLAFYDAALAPLDLVRVVEFGDEEEDDAAVEAAGWGGLGAAPVLWIVGGATPTSGVHLEFAARRRADVELFHAAGVAAGGTSHAAPRRWAIYRRGRFGASVRDPDGNVIEAVAPE